MCGIAGIFKFRNQPVSRQQLSALTYAMRHRGRDNETVVVGGDAAGAFTSYPGIGLGHRRLSIIDLSDESNQPMASGSGKSMLVFNGELYNYIELRKVLVKAGLSFRTNSDTEVILNAYEYWGEACVDHFNGMFAFAIWNDAEKHLFCARDPLGIKPFYYSLDRDGFAFASESAALKCLAPHALNRDAVYAYLLGMYVPGQNSIYQDVHKLMPGHSMRIGSDGHIMERRYWQLPVGSRQEVSEQQAAAEMSLLLDKAVEMQLRSDVPVGALLSGGFDSSLLVATAAGKIDRMHTFSIGFDSAEQPDELRIAAALAKRYNTRHTELKLLSGDVMTYLDKAIMSLSEPVSDSAIVPTYCLTELAAANGVKVLLSGAGGDELFGGYTRYTGYSGSRKLFLNLPRPLRQLLGNTLLRNTELGLRLQSPSLDMALCEASAPQLVRHLLQQEGAFPAFLNRLRKLYREEIASEPLLYQQMHFDLQTYLPDLLLYEFDQVTMAHTVEGRVPYLDKNLVQQSYTYKPSLHVQGTDTKRIQKLMARGKIHEDTYREKKQGFSGPVKKWVQENEAIFLERIRDAHKVPSLEELDTAALCSQFKQPGNTMDHHVIFALFCLVTWYNAKVNDRK